MMMKALAKDPEDRYSNAIDLHDDLQSFLYSIGEFYSRKDLAGWMKKTFAAEIEEDNAKLESYRQIAAPVAAPGEVSRRAAVAGAHRAHGRGAAASRPGGTKAAGTPRPRWAGTTRSWTRRSSTRRRERGRQDRRAERHRSLLRGRRPHGGQRAAARHPRAGASARAAGDAEAAAETAAPIKTLQREEFADPTPPPLSLPKPPAPRRPTLTGVPPTPLRTNTRPLAPIPPPPAPPPPPRTTPAQLRRSGLNLPPAQVVAPMPPVHVPPAMPMPPPPAMPPRQQFAPPRPQPHRSGPATSPTSCRGRGPKGAAASSRSLLAVLVLAGAGRRILVLVDDQQAGADRGHHGAGRRDRAGRQHEGGRPLAGLARAAARSLHAVGHARRLRSQRPERRGARRPAAAACRDAGAVARHGLRADERAAGRPGLARRRGDQRGRRPAGAHRLPGLPDRARTPRAGDQGREPVQALAAGRRGRAGRHPEGSRHADPGRRGRRRRRRSTPPSHAEVAVAPPPPHAAAAAGAPRRAAEPAAGRARGAGARRRRRRRPAPHLPRHKKGHDVAVDDGAGATASADDDSGPKPRPTGATKVATAA